MSVSSSSPSRNFRVGQQFSGALAGSSSVDDALAAAQNISMREMTKAGYIK
jgi:sorbitol/mannitol transport system substrate-binding protein